MLSLNMRFEGVVILNSFTMCFNSLFFINITVILFIIKSCIIVVFLIWFSCVGVFHGILVDTLI